MPLSGVTLVLGGARSGKSRFAEGLAESAPGRSLYLATAEARDSEMRARIKVHQDRRGGRWETLEEPLEVAAALQRESREGRVILLDCLTLWLANLLEQGRDPRAQGEALVALFAGLSGPLILVSNEIGLGIVPENALARRFRDHQGWLNQAVAAKADCVVFMAAGLPLALKGGLPPQTARGC